ncbi:MAG: GNAT family N-acetyltransferase [Clostridia bacterium]|nr:GNAT family N-acetyltransferase [Clostridia bacterium]
MFTINNFKYRKAFTSDLEKIANLVTDLLGTCNIDKNNNKVKTKKEILIDNKKEIQKDINNYYVCELNNQIIGACGISNIKIKNDYKIDLGEYREILYLVVKHEYQKQGIGTKLMHLCCDNIKEQIIYEAWGDKEDVNSKFLLEKLEFELLKDLGDTYYKDNGYCSYCINRNNNCTSCKAQIWVKGE